MSNPRQSSVYFGAVLLMPTVFFGLGIVGVGEDHLTTLTGNFRLSKFILGALVSVSTICLVNGVITLRDGVVIHRVD